MKEISITWSGPPGTPKKLVFQKNFNFLYTKVYAVKLVSFDASRQGELENVISMSSERPSTLEKLVFQKIFNFVLLFV